MAKQIPKEIFDRVAYSEDSPTGLVLKTSNMSKRKDYLRDIGDVAGTLRTVGDKRYWKIRFKSKTYSVHRVIYEMFFGEIPEGLCIDHINGDSCDNKISNLRLVSMAVNNRNRKQFDKNTTGVTGVRLVTRKFKSKTAEYFSAHYVDLSGKLRSKAFNIEKLGYDKAFEMAKNWREEMIELLNNSGAGYTDRHGTLN
jgi:hypothetical protein